MRFLRPREVVQMIGVSRATLWRMVRAGQFPPPVRITIRNRGYLLESVETWMRARAEGRPLGIWVAEAEAHSISPSTARSEPRLAKRRSG